MDAPNREDPGRFKEGVQGGTVTFWAGVAPSPEAKVVKLLFVHQEDPSRTILAERDMNTLRGDESQTKFVVPINVPGNAAPGLYKWQGVRIETAAGKTQDLDDVSQQAGSVWLEVHEEPKEVRIVRGNWQR